MINVRALLVISISMLPTIIVSNGTLNEFNGRPESLELIIKSHASVLVDFGAQWCGPCKNLKPELAKIAKLKPNLHIVLINFDQYRSLANQYAVTSLPTLLLFKDGVFVKRIIGYQRSDTLITVINQSIT